MPLITPPTDQFDGEEKTVISYEESKEISPAEYERIKRFLDVPNWMCPECQAVNFGRNKNCAYCFGRRRTVTPRPSTYIEPPL